MTHTKTSEDVYQAASMDNIGSSAMLFGMRYVSIRYVITNY